MNNKVETINFKAFLNNSYKEPLPKKKSSVKAYSIVAINPYAFIDPTICIIGAGVLTLALLEKFLARQGNFDIVEKIQGFTSIIFPAVGLGAVIYFFAKNPFFGWM